MWFRLPRFSLFLIVWHAILIVFTFFNWRYFVSEEESMLEPNVPRIHLAFNLIASIVYIFFASLLMFWPYRYGSFMLPNNRRDKVLIGVALCYFTHVLPMWALEFSIVWDHGWFVMIQTLSFILLCISFIIETIVVWYAYIWHMSGYVHRTYGGTRFGLGYSKVLPDGAK